MRYFLLLLLVISYSAHSTEYIGRGYDLREQTLLTGQCIEPIGDAITTAGFVEYNANLSSNVAEDYRRTSASGRIAGNVIVVSGSVSVELDYSYFESTTAIEERYFREIEDGLTSYREYRLTSLAESLYQNSPTEFRRVCGTGFIAAQGEGSLMNSRIVLTFDSEEEQKYYKKTTKVSVLFGLAKHTDVDIDEYLHEFSINRITIYYSEFDDTQSRYINQSYSCSTNFRTCLERHLEMLDRLYLAGDSSDDAGVIYRVLPYTVLGLNPYDPINEFRLDQVLLVSNQRLARLRHMETALNRCTLNKQSDLQYVRGLIADIDLQQGYCVENPDMNCFTELSFLSTAPLNELSSGCSLFSS